MSMGPYIRNIKYGGKEILKLLDAVWVPKWVAVIHCQGHQKGDVTIAWGNWRADKRVQASIPHEGTDPQLP
jgi:hypothetical protein